MAEELVGRGKTELTAPATVTPEIAGFVDLQVCCAFNILGCTASVWWQASSENRSNWELIDQGS
jgi:hypothetical protein